MTARARTTDQTNFRRRAVIHRLESPEAVRAHLTPAAAYSAYALAYLDSRLFHLADFYEATSDKRRALLMHARGGLGPTTLTLGDVELVQALIALHPGPRQTFLTCETSHVDTLLASHDLWRPQTMLRMELSRASFMPPQAPPSLPGQTWPAVRRLAESDASELNRLYALEGDSLRYSGRQVKDGLYFGVYNRQSLVSAAGTHIYSTRESVGVIGNVFTHPDFRGRGHGTAVTAAVAAQLLQHCDLVVLNVDPANRTARHIYERLGFRDSTRLTEAMATRRDPISPLAPLRRILGRWRASTPNTEVVEL